MSGARAPLHGRDHRPGGCDPIPGGLMLGDWVTPTLQSPWENVDDACPFQYRWGPHDEDDTVDVAGIEFHGQITGGTSGSLVFSFPSEDTFSCEKDFLIEMLDDTDTATVAAVHIDTAGNLTITWPIEGGTETAADIAIVDAGGNFTATDVEAALAELASDLGTVIVPRVVELLVTDPNGSAITTGDGQARFFVPALLNGYNLTAAHAAVSTVSSSGTPTIQINNVTQAADMLSTRITIDASEKTSYTAATPPVIDTSNDDVATGDEIRVDVDVAGTGTKGLVVILTFEEP